MALVPCRECSAQISSLALSCPKCGASPRGIIRPHSSPPLERYSLTGPKLSRRRIALIAGAAAIGVAALIPYSSGLTYQEYARSVMRAVRSEAAYAYAAWRYRNGNAWKSVQVVRDVTGDGLPDTLILEGRGSKLDSLTMTFTIRSRGEVVYRDSWGAQYLARGFEGHLQDLPKDSVWRRMSSYFNNFFASSAFTIPWRSYLEERAPSCIGTRRALLACIREELADFSRARIEARGDSGSSTSLANDDSFARELSALSGNDQALSQFVDLIARDLAKRGTTDFDYWRGYESRSALVWNSRYRRFFDVESWTD